MSGWEQVERQQAQLLAKTVDEKFWRGFLQENPDVLHRLIADLYRATETSSTRPASLDELWGLVHPTFSNEPFGTAVRELLAGRSVRWLAKQMHLDHSVLLRALTGERGVVNLQDPERSMKRIEAVARALRVHPSHFQEWRRLWIVTLLDCAFAEQPHLSTGLYKRLAGVAERPRRERALRA